MTNELKTFAKELLDSSRSLASVAVRMKSQAEILLQLSQRSERGAEALATRHTTLKSAAERRADRQFANSWYPPIVMFRDMQALLEAESWSILPTLPHPGLTPSQSCLVSNVYKALRMATIFTIGELITADPANLSKYINVGTKTLWLIEMYLRQHRLWLGMKTEDLEIDEPSKIFVREKRIKELPRFDDLLSDLPPETRDKIIETLDVDGRVEHAAQLQLFSKRELLRLHSMRREWVQIIEDRLMKVGLHLR